MIFIKTEYSFKEVFYPLEKAVRDAASNRNKDICIIDSTPFGFIKFEKACIENNVTPIYGLTTTITDSSRKARSKYDTCDMSEEIILIAKSQKGVSDLYKIYSKSTERYNRFNRILPEDLVDMDLIVICNKFDVATIKRKDICIRTAIYSDTDDKSTYQCITGSRGPDITHREYDKAGIDRKNNIPLEVEKFRLKGAKMLTYSGKDKFGEECWVGLANLGHLMNDEYCKRLKYEIEMIESKNFQDYFMIVREMIKTAKKTMIVGPGRGSSGGSLVCYVLGITSIDPIEHELIFERFIDVNRDDYPDIDTDYPDTRRQDVIDQTAKLYKSVYKLATISKYSPRTIINDFAKEYGIPPYETDELKSTIIERSSGDARAKACLEDTLEGEAGKKFIEKFPEMSEIYRAEGHARHFGTHAAGIIVLDEEVENYGAIDHKSNILCLEGKDAEGLGLLKIDCLGLRTLSVIENCLTLSGIPLSEIYNVRFDDAKVLDVFNHRDLADVFQFDGRAIGMVCNDIVVRKFMDVVDITALGRPGALNSGGTTRYILVAKGDKERKSHGEIFDRITKDTCGIVIYQEQTMQLLREFGNLAWEDVNIMRRIISKSRGDEFFNKYKEKFIDGGMDNGYTKQESIDVWEAIASMGSYAFNKSHAVAYGMISYWCAYLKVHRPFNFLAANLNNAKDKDHALKMLRRYVKTHDIEYTPVDVDTSAVGWTIQDGKLVGGLTNIDGIGEKKALDIIERREPGSKKKLTKTMIKNLMNPVTKFDVLYPIETEYAHIYESYNITKIDDIEVGTQVTTFGRLILKDLRDRNDVQTVIKRGYKVDKDRYFLNITIEDDTGIAKGTIVPFNMEKMDGIALAESLTIGDVIAISGATRQGWSAINISGIKNVKDI